MSSQQETSLRYFQENRNAAIAEHFEGEETSLLVSELKGISIKLHEMRACKP